MNILQIDCESYAARVAYVAATDMLRLLGDDEKRTLLPPSLVEDEQGNVVASAAFVISQKVEKGETLFQHQRQVLRADEYKGKAWLDLTLEDRLAMDLFVAVVREVNGRLTSLQKEAEREAERAPANPKPKIEDTIFAPIGSMGEMLPHAVDASRQIQDVRKAEAAEADRVAAEKAALKEEGSGEAPGVVQSMSAGSADPSATAGDAKSAGEELPPVPNQPVKTTAGEKAPRKPTPCKTTGKRRATTSRKTGSKSPAASDKSN